MVCRFWGGPIEEVDEFIYLGSVVSKKGGTDEDIQARIGKARRAFVMLRPIWRSTALTTKPKLRIFESNVKQCSCMVLKLGG